MQWVRRWAVHVWPTHEKTLLRVLLATLFPLALVWMIVSPIPTIVDGHFYDKVLASYPAPPKSDVQIISIDEESIQRIGPWPWPEAVHTKFFNQLARQAPKGVVLNFRLGLPVQTAEDDAAMELALRRLPVFFSVQAAPSPAVLKQDAAFLARRERFASAVAGVGHANLAPDGAIERLRFIDLFAQADGATVPYVGAMVNPDRAVQQAIAGRTNLHLGIPFHGELSHPSIPYSDVLEGKLLPDQLKGRTIVVGPSRDVTLGALAVLWYVSSGSGSGSGTTLVSSTEVHASAIDALQQGSYMLGASPLVLYLSLAISLFLAFLAFDKVPKAAPLMAIAFVGICFAMSALMLRLFRLWIPPSFFILGIVPAYLLWSWQNMHSILGFLKEHIVTLSELPAGKSDPAGPFLVRANDPIDRYVGALDHSIVRIMQLEAYMRFSLLKLPIAVVLCRSDGSIKVLNAAATALLPELAPSAPSVAEKGLPAIVARLEAKSSVRRPELDEHWSRALGGEYSTPQGKIFSIEATCIDDVPAPAPATWIVLLRELTQERQAERERADWLNFLWHDLRSPQINLLSLVELFEMRPSRVGVTELVAGVRHEAERTIALAQSFISVSNSEVRDYEFAVVSLSSLLAKSIDALTAYALARHVQLLVRPIENHHDLIHADGGMLMRAFSNILENGIRHSASGDIIRASCSITEGLDVVVIIQDEGTGMAPAVLDALLDGKTRGLPEKATLLVSERAIEEARNSTPRDPRTHGFGFAMVRQVVATHGGWISGRSTVGEGTTFTMGFPLVPVANASGA